jgi:hypothetical protein
MRFPVEVSSSRIFWQSTLLLVLAFSSLPLISQKAQETTAPEYNLQAETKMKGTIEEFKLPPKGREKGIVHLLVKTAADTADIYVCPESFLETMGMNFNKGDELGLTGSKVRQGELDVILAREIVKGSDTFVLRDGKGSPVW